MPHSPTIDLNPTQKVETHIRLVTYSLAHKLARFLVRRGHFQGLRSNLAVVYRLPLASPDLEERVIENLRSAFVCYVDFFIVACRGPEAIESACELDPAGIRLIDKLQADGRGVVLVAAHSSSLDIFMLAMSKRFPGVQALTLSQPPWNTRIMNRLRSKYGLQLTPITSSSLRAAFRRLKQGGMVGIAADVPTEYGAELNLFGETCRLPLGHTRLAEATGAAIVVGICQRLGPGQYQGFAVEIPRDSGDEEDWAADTLHVVERYIMERPQEWFMPPPLWPPSRSETPLLLQHQLPPALTSRLIRG